MGPLFSVMLLLTGATQGLGADCLREAATASPIPTGILDAQHSVNHLACSPVDRTYKEINGSLREITPYLQGSLSPFWAQEFIGADLARESIDEYAKRHPVGPAPFAVLDSFMNPDAINGRRLAPGFREIIRSNPGFGGRTDVAGHGTAVINLVGADGMVGVAARPSLVLAREVPFADDRSEKRTTEKVNLALDALGDLSSQPVLKGKAVLVNLSVTLSEDKALIERMNSFVASGVIWVKAAGNSFPDPVNLPVRDLNSIVVGSLSPWGAPSDFSQEDGRVTILAPSDRFLSTPGVESSRLDAFSGTSGATPLVTGALNNVTLLLPDLNLAEAKALLEKTSIPTINSREVPRKNGAGTVNAYKLALVAARLKERGWPAARGRIFDDPSLFDFTNERNRILDELRAVSDGSCEQERARIRKLRAVLLLDPSHRETRQSLVSKFTAMGLRTNALLYQNSDPEKPLEEVLQGLLAERDRFPRLTHNDSRRSRMEESDPKLRWKALEEAVFRLLISQGKASAPSMTALIPEEYEDHWKSFMTYLNKLGTDGIEVRKAWARGKDPYLAKEVLEGCSRFGPQCGEIAVAATENVDPEVRARALLHFETVPVAVAREILSREAQSSVSWLQERARKLLDQLPKDLASQAASR